MDPGRSYEMANRGYIHQPEGSGPPPYVTDEDSGGFDAPNRGPRYLGGPMLDPDRRTPDSDRYALRDMPPRSPTGRVPSDDDVAPPRPPPPTDLDDYGSPRQRYSPVPDDYPPYSDPTYPQPRRSPSPRRSTSPVFHGPLARDPSGPPSPRRRGPSPERRPHSPDRRSPDRRSPERPVYRRTPSPDRRSPSPHRQPPSPQPYDDRAPYTQNGPRGPRYPDPVYAQNSRNHPEPNYRPDEEEYIGTKVSPVYTIEATPDTLNKERNRSRGEDQVDAPTSTKSTEKLIREQKRDTWDNKSQYLLAVIGYAVGLGNVWRFPYLAQRNGGGAFLIPYLIMLVVEGFPLLVLELSLGQRLRKGPWQVWYNLSPYAAGLGVAMFVSAAFTASYYNTILAWIMFYLFNSFQYPLPWSECGTTIINDTTMIDPECEVSSPTKWFWYRSTLDISPDISTSDGISWKIFICLIAAWFLVFICLLQGIKSSGKVIYFTATFPYVVLTILLIRGLTLPGMEDGLYHLFYPDLSRLTDPAVWLEASTQIFFSLSLAGGGLIAYASYLPPDNNVFTDALIVSAVNSGTSIYAGIAIFSIVGYKANIDMDACETNRTEALMSLLGRVDDIPDPGSDVIISKYNEFGVMKDYEFTMPNITECSLESFLENSVSGTGLAFMTMTEAINQFGPSAPFWAILFFFMMVTLGLDSMFGMMECVITSLRDMKMFNNVRREFISGFACLGLFLLAICFSSKSGEYILSMFDYYAATLPLLINAFFECIAVGWIYTLSRFADDYECMTGFRPNYYLMICWKYVSPLVMFVIFFWMLIELIQTGAEYYIWDATEGVTVLVQFPGWAQFCCAMLTLMVVLWIPVFAIFSTVGLLPVYDDEPSYFPAEELRAKFNIQQHRPGTVEKMVFYPEQILWPDKYPVDLSQQPPSHVAIRT